MFERIIDYCDDIITKNGDPRTLSYPTMESPKTMIILVIMYIAFIKLVAPKFMENRKPYDLKNTMFYYNLFQVILSAYLFYENVYVWYFGGYKFWSCNNVDYSTSPLAQKTLLIAYIYYLSKYTEFLDTVFFILRKKYNQASFLHIYHHASMPVYTWIVVRFFAGGTLAIACLLNTFIHTVMYTYYLIAGLGPQYQKYVWWKKYMTGMQLMQFSIGVVHFAVSIFSGDCNIPRWFIIGYAMNGIFLYLLFSNFYKKEYKKTVTAPANNASNGTLTMENERTKEKCA